MIKDTTQIELNKLASQMSPQEFHKRVQLTMQYQKHHPQRNLQATAMSVADYIIEIEGNYYRNFSTLRKKHIIKNHLVRPYPITITYLQKIMYYLNVIHLLKYQKPLIIDKPFETWNYGPAIVSISQEYETYNCSLVFKPIHHIASLYDRNGNFNPVYYPKCKYLLTEHTQNFIKHYIWKFNNIKPLKLIAYSHQETQWKQRRNSHTPYNNFKTISYYRLPQHQFWH